MRAKIAPYEGFHAESNCCISAVPHAAVHAAASLAVTTPEVIPEPISNKAELDNYSECIVIIDAELKDIYLS